MTSFNWSVLTASLAGGLGVGLIAFTALRRRTVRRHAELAQVGPRSRRRRIDVVAIDEAAGRSLERKEDE
jgi:small neutral amino acid transporter SnatA (MarC family)